MFTTSRLPFALVAAAGLSTIAASASAQCPAVTNFNAQSRGCSVRLSWAPAPGSLPPSLWEIYRNTSNTLTGALPIGALPAGTLAFDDSPPQRGTTYFYFIRGLVVLPATCPQGPQFSPSVSGMLLPVATPAGLSPSVTCAGVTLNWNPLPDTVSFEIRRRVDGVVTVLGAVPGNSTSYFDSTGAPGVSYDYFVIPTLACSTGVTSFFGVGALYPGAPVPSATAQPISTAVNSGQDAFMDFSLIANGALNPTFTVQHDGVNVPLNAASQFRYQLNGATGQLVVVGAKPSDSGIYTLRMTNNCGTTTQSVARGPRSPAFLHPPASASAGDHPFGRRRCCIPAGFTRLTAADAAPARPHPPAPSRCRRARGWSRSSP